MAIVRNKDLISFSSGDVPAHHRMLARPYTRGPARGVLRLNPLLSRRWHDGAASAHTQHCEAMYSYLSPVDLAIISTRRVIIPGHKVCDPVKNQRGSLGCCCQNGNRTEAIQRWLNR